MYFLDRSILTRSIFLLGVFLIFIMFLFKRLNKFKALFETLFYTVIFIYLEERLLPFPLTFKVLYSLSSWKEQFVVKLDYILYIKFWVFGGLVTFTALIIFKNIRKLTSLILTILLLMAFLDSFSFLVNSLCHGIYKLIDPIENALFMLGSILGYYLHTKYFLHLSLQHNIDANRVKKIYNYDF